MSNGTDVAARCWFADAPHRCHRRIGRLTVDAFRRLVPEAGRLIITRHELANLHALNFVIVGYLGEGVAANTAFDGQAKGLGEYLRSRRW